VVSPPLTTSPSSTVSADPIMPTTPAYIACAGEFDSNVDVAQDRGGHAQFVGMPRNMALEVSFASVHIRGHEPFVDVSGTIDASGSFDASGRGTVAGFRNVSVRMSGTLRDCSDTAGTMTAEYSMGTNGELPGGQPIVFAVRGSK
jgi:hypothetical protein